MFLLVPAQPQNPESHKTVVVVVETVGWSDAAVSPCLTILIAIYLT